MTVARVAVAGASGYTGAELVRLLAQHPNVTLTAVTSITVCHAVSDGPNAALRSAGVLPSKQ